MRSISVNTSVTRKGKTIQNIMVTPNAEKMLREVKSDESVDELLMSLFDGSFPAIIQSLTDIRSQDNKMGAVTILFTQEATSDRGEDFVLDLLVKEYKQDGTYRMDVVFALKGESEAEFSKMTASKTFKPVVINKNTILH